MSWQSDLRVLSQIRGLAWTVSILYSKQKIISAFSNASLYRENFKTTGIWAKYKVWQN